MDSCSQLKLSKLVEDLRLEVVHMPESKVNTVITNTDINRSGLQIAGFTRHFDYTRIQVFGMVENDYLNDIDADTRRKNLDKFFSFDFPCLIITRNLYVPDDVIEMAIKHEVPILRTPTHTSSFVSGIIYYLNRQLGEQITRHGVFIEVYGEGILLLGESGVGKSETAIELV